MDMSDTGRPPAVPAPETANAAPAAEAAQERWHQLVSEMGAEIAVPLTAALERINALTSTGRIDKKGLRSLREEVEAARQIGMIGQQLARFASGRLRQTHEKLQLADVLDGTLAHRARETHARGINVKPTLQPADVIVDASLLFSLLNTTLDWALANAQSQIDFAIEMKTWPAHAILTCRFAHRAADDLADGAGAVAPFNLDSLGYRLIEQTAWTMGLVVERRDESHMTTLTLEFPRTAKAAIESVSGIEVDDGFAPSSNSQPLAGSHVLVISSRRDLRGQVRDAVRNMSLIVDYVNTVEEAVAFCREGLPHAIVVEAIQAGARFEALRDEILAEVRDFVFIELVEESESFDMSGFTGATMVRVGRDALATALPSTLLFELSKSVG